MEACIKTALLYRYFLCSLTKGLIEKVQIEKSDLENIIKETVKATILELGFGKQVPKQNKTAYQKTEQLLYNFRGFQRVVKEKQEQIEEIKKYGVPHKGSAVHTYCGGSDAHGLSTEEETVDSVVYAVQMSVQDIEDVINMIKKAMLAMKNDPYYNILEMRYFDGMSQEDIAKALNCTQQNISYHKNRLVKELALRIFPNDVAKEMIQ